MVFGPVKKNFANWVAKVLTHPGFRNGGLLGFSNGGLNESGARILID
jgi:hypothetical protein